MSELPNGWTAVSISDITRTRSGNSKLIKGTLLSAPVSGSFPAFSASGQDVWYHRAEHEGDAVIVSAVGARCGKSFIARGKWSAVANTHIVWPSLALDLRFLYLHLNNEKFWEKGGSAQPFIKVNKTFERLFNLPPAKEQCRIVAKIDSLAAKSRRVYDNLDRTSRLIDKYRISILSRAFKCHLIAGNFERKMQPISTLIVSLDQGWSPKCENEPAILDSQWAVMKTTAVQAISFKANENKKLPVDLVPRPALQVAMGDIVITRAGPRNRVGICAYVERTRPNLMICDKVYRLKVDRTIACPKFVTFMLNSPEIMQKIEGMKSGINDSGLNLTQSKFLKIEIPCPNLDVQRRIVDFVERALVSIDRLAVETAHARKLLDHLDQAILAKAFRGELVPQDPDDEPASVLLERIKAQNVGVVPARSARGRPRLTQTI